MSGWIKLHRSLKDWKWYHDHNATRLLIHLLINVNYEEKKWQDMIIKPGSMVTSWENLAQNVQLSVRQCRTAMEKLEASNEVTRTVTNRFQLISLVKWKELQGGDDNLTNTMTVRCQTDDKQMTTTKEDKEYKEEKNINGFSFRKSLYDLEIDKKLVDDFLKNRKLRRLANTETAFKNLKNEFEKNNIPLNMLMEKIVSNGWGSFKNSWLNKESDKKISLAQKMKQDYNLT